MRLVKEKDGSGIDAWCYVRGDLHLVVRMDTAISDGVAHVDEVELLQT